MTFGAVLLLVLLVAWFLAALLVCWILDCAGREPLMTREEADRLREAVRAALADQERRNVLMVVKPIKQQLGVATNSKGALTNG